MAKTDLDDIDRAVLEQYLKKPGQLPTVVVNNRVLDELTVERSLRKASVRQAVQRAVANMTHAVFMPRALNFLDSVVQNESAGTRERVSAAKALLTFDRQLNADRQKGNDADLTKLSPEQLHDFIAECEAEAARRAKPVKQDPAPVTSSVFD